MMAKTDRKIKRVAFFGDAEAKKTDQHFIDAYRTAKYLAENGYIIVNGGGAGVMLASTLGAKHGGGEVETVVLALKDQPKNFEGECKENASASDKRIETSNYNERLGKLAEIADAYVIFKGGTGTIAELGFTWSKAKFDFGHHKPLIFFGSFWNEIIGSMVKNLDLEKTEQEVYEITEKTEDVLTILKNNKILPNWINSLKKIISN